MKKKAYGLIMATIMVFSMAGCGATKAANSNVADTQMTDEAADDSKASEADKEAAGECPRIKFTTVYPEFDSQYLSAWTVQAEVENECYATLNDSVKKVFDDDYKEFCARLEEESAESEEYNNNLVDDGTYNQLYYTDYKQPVLRRSDDKVVSINLVQYAYSGGAHGGEIDYTYNFDTQTGKLLDFTDLGDISAEVKAYIFSYIDANENIKESLFEEYKDTIETDFSDNTCSLPFYLDGRGLTVIFPQYEIAPYATGKVFITVPYEEIKSFEQKYLPTEDFYTIDLEDYWYSPKVDLNGDGTEEEISFQLQYDENYEYITGATLSAGKSSVDVGTQSAHEGYSGLFVHKDGHNYMFVKTDDSNDWKGVMIYELGDKIEFLQEIGEGLSIMYYDMVTLSSRVNIFGTYGVERDYVFDEKVGLKPVSTAEDCYRCTGEPDYNETYGHIEVKKAFKDADGKEVPVGTKLYPCSTNDDGIITMVTPDGDKIKIKYETKSEGWGIMVDGVDEMEIFGDMIPYAG